MRVPADRSVVDMLETNNIQRFEARRQQAARRRGVGAKNGGHPRAATSASRQQTCTSVVPPVPGRRSPVRGAAQPWPWFLLVGVGGLTFVGLLALIGGIAVWRWIWP